MDFLLDNEEIERIFKKIVSEVPSMKNGITVEGMQKRGINYETNWGVSIVNLKEFALRFSPNHLLALKLWNKGWRETKILASLLEEPNQINEEQMDFWLKTSEQPEVVEQLVMNIFTKTPMALAKAFEYCRGKKFTVKYAGLLMIGRLALTSKNDIDEMFEPAFELMFPLAKDEKLTTIVYRTSCQLARRSNYLLDASSAFALELTDSENATAKQLGHDLKEELSSDFYLPNS